MTSSDPHAATTDVAYLGASELAVALAHGSTSSEAVVSALQSRIAAVDAAGSQTQLRSVLAVAADALDVARERDRERAAGRVRGALHGVPVLVKDNIEAVGLPGTAGAIVLGATNLSQWA
ncbi:MAG: amidase, partial [Actinobacteria bacterium]|nr:amidase [Actinomycetota bacterium]